MEHRCRNSVHKGSTVKFTNNTKMVREYKKVSNYHRLTRPYCRVWMRLCPAQDRLYSLLLCTDGAINRGRLFCPSLNVTESRRALVPEAAYGPLGMRGILNDTGHWGSQGRGGGASPCSQSGFGNSYGLKDE